MFSTNVGLDSHVTSPELCMKYLGPAQYSGFVEQNCKFQRTNCIDVGAGVACHQP